VSGEIESALHATRIARRRLALDTRTRGATQFVVIP